MFVYKEAGRHMMERYLSIDYSVHLLKCGLTQVQFCKTNHV